MEDNKNYQNNIQDKRLEAIEASVKIINHELGEVNISLVKLTGINRTYQIILPILTGLTGLLLSRLI